MGVLSGAALLAPAEVPGRRARDGRVIPVAVADMRAMGERAAPVAGRAQRADARAVRGVDPTARAADPAARGAVPAAQEAVPAEPGDALVPRVADLVVLVRPAVVDVREPGRPVNDGAPARGRAAADGPRRAGVRPEQVGVRPEQAVVQRDQVGDLRAIVRAVTPAVAGPRGSGVPDATARHEATTVVTREGRESAHHVPGRRRAERPAVGLVARILDVKAGRHGAAARRAAV